jgi:predicted DNA-binding protein YlxM (UPF0122 family)
MEVKILRLLKEDNMTMSQLSIELDRPKSWISNTLNNMEKKGLLVSNREGMKKFWKISDREFSNSLIKLINEEKMLNIDKLLTYSSLQILPLLLNPGYSVNEILKMSSVSRNSVYKKIQMWKGSGIVYLDKNKKYRINPNQKILIEFLTAYQKYNNNSLLKEIYPKGIIIWQWRDEFIFSISNIINDTRFKKAAYTRLTDFNYNISYQNEYYMHTSYVDEISEEEALIQSLKIDEKNPRIKEIIIEQFMEDSINNESINEYCTKYHTKTIIKELRKNASKKVIHSERTDRFNK